MLPLSAGKNKAFQNKIYSAIKNQESATIYTQKTWLCKFKLCYVDFF